VPNTTHLHLRLDNSGSGLGTGVGAVDFRHGFFIVGVVNVGEEEDEKE
jgi:hypothetical protein